MKLTEIFNKPAPIKWGKKGKTITGDFTVGEEDYVIYFSPGPPPYDDQWGIEFVQKVAGKKRDKLGLTGTGKEFQVFSTVINGIKDWIKKKKPGVIEFDAAGESRKKLYTRLVKTLIKSIPYKIDVEDAGVGSFGVYRLERTK